MKRLGMVLALSILFASVLVPWGTTSGVGEINCARDGVVTANSPGQVLSQNILTNGQTSGEYIIADSPVTFTIAMPQECTVTKLVLFLLVQDGRIRKYHEVKASLALQQESPNEVFNTGPRGSSLEFVTTLTGKEIVLSSPQNVRYVIVSSSGGTVDGEFRPNENNWVEVEAWGTPVGNTTPTPTPTPTPAPTPSTSLYSNVALGKAPTASSTNYPGSLSAATNGKWDDYAILDSGTQYLQLDLQGQYEIFWIDFTHYWDSRYWPVGTTQLIYKDVMIELMSNCLSSSLLVPFNNRAGGPDTLYPETDIPKRIYVSGRVPVACLRAWSNGNTNDLGNHYEELAAYGRPFASSFPQLLYDLARWNMELLLSVDEKTGASGILLYEGGGYGQTTGIREVTDDTLLSKYGVSRNMLKVLPNTINTDELSRIGYCGANTSKANIPYTSSVEPITDLYDLVRRYDNSKTAGVSAQTGRTCEGDVSHLPLVPQPNIVVSGSLTISPSGSVAVGTTLNSQFAIINRGTSTVTLGELVAGGRLNGVADCSNMPAPGVCPDFTKQYSVTLAPGATHTYTGTFTPSVAGNYDFQVFYRVGKDQWYWNLDPVKQVVVTVGDPTKFLTLPFPQDPNMQIGWAWLKGDGTQHGGIDYIKGTDINNEQTWLPFNVYAAAPGIACQKTFVWDGTGYMVRVKHGNGYITEYLHLDPASIPSIIPSCAVSQDQWKPVQRGEKIGVASDSGSPKLIHLHLQLRDQNETLIDPYGLYGKRDIYPDPNGTNGKTCGSVVHYWIQCPPAYP